jgi:hypothetical protein
MSVWNAGDAATLPAKMWRWARTRAARCARVVGLSERVLGIGEEGAVRRIRWRRGRRVGTSGRCGVGESGKRTGR